MQEHSCGCCCGGWWSGAHVPSDDQLLFTTPGVFQTDVGPLAISVLPGQFLLKDLVLIAALLWALDDRIPPQDARSGAIPRTTHEQLPCWSLQTLARAQSRARAAKIRSPASSRYEDTAALARSPAQVHALP